MEVGLSMLVYLPPKSPIQQGWLEVSEIHTDLLPESRNEPLAPGLSPGATWNRILWSLLRSSRSFPPKKLSLSIFECFLQPLFILLSTLSL